MGFHDRGHHASLALQLPGRSWPWLLLRWPTSLAAGRTSGRGGQRSSPWDQARVAVDEAMSEQSRRRGGRCLTNMATAPPLIPPTAMMIRSPLRRDASLPCRAAAAAPWPSGPSHSAEVTLLCLPCLASHHGELCSGLVISSYVHRVNHLVSSTVCASSQPPLTGV